MCVMGLKQGTTQCYRPIANIGSGGGFTAVPFEKPSCLQLFFTCSDKNTPQYVFIRNKGRPVETNITCQPINIYHRVPFSSKEVQNNCKHDDLLMKHL